MTYYIIRIANPKDDDNANEIKKHLENIYFGTVDVQEISLCNYEETMEKIDDCAIEF